MKLLVILYAAIGVMALIACNGNVAETTPELDATVAAGIRATLQADRATDATVEARVSATLTSIPVTRPPEPGHSPKPITTPRPTPTAAATPPPAVRPTPTPSPTPTSTPVPTSTPSPTATPVPTSTPSPTATPVPTPTRRATATPGTTPTRPWYPTATPYPWVTPEPTRTRPHRPTSTPVPPRVPLPTVSPSQWSTIREYAAERAGGPGAIYVGDLGQLAGRASYSGLGDADDLVPLEALENHLYVYESEYYQNLIRRARIDNPTAMTSRLDNRIVIQFACVNRASLWCELAKVYFAHNLLVRTEGQVEIVFTSLPKLGIAGPSVPRLLRDNVLNMVEVFGPHVAGDLPQMDFLSLYGLYSSREQQYKAVVDAIPELERLIVNETGGYSIGINWADGGDLYILTKRPLYTLEDLTGLKTRSLGAPMSTWLNGMGAKPILLAPAEVYIAMKRSIIDAAAVNARAGFNQGLYEVSIYLGGPVISWPVSFNVINGEEWESIPSDLQEIMKEEAAKFELEALRLAAIQNDYALQLLSNAGMEYIEFSAEMQWMSQKAAIESVIPAWVNRLGGPYAPFVELFNRIHEPLLGVRINEDGQVSQVK